MRLLSLVALAAIVAALVAGSSGAAPARQSTDAKAWAGQVCTSLKAWESSIGKRSNALSHVKQTNLRAVRDAFVTFLQGVVADTDTLVAKTKAAGSPDVSHGSDVAGALQTGLKQLRRYFAGDLARARSLPTHDAKKLGAAVTALGTAIDKQATAIGKTFDGLDKKYHSAELDKAMKSVPACRGI